MTRRQILEKTARETLKNLNLNRKSTVKSLIAELEKTKKEITTTLKGVKRFEMGYLRNILNSINEKIDEYSGKMNSAVISSSNFALNQGAELMPKILKDIGYNFTFGKLSDELIVTGKNFTVGLIKNMSNEMKSDVSFQIRKAILTGDNTFNTARKLDSVIGVTKKTGYLNRSDVISRTEINRAYSLAKHLRDEDVVKVLPDLQRIWRTGFNPRNKDMGGGRGFISHSAVDGQIRKINEPFDVGGEKLQYPRDPNGKPENIINCNCFEEPYMEDWA